MKVKELPRTSNLKFSDILPGQVFYGSGLYWLKLTNNGYASLGDGSFRICGDSSYKETDLYLVDVELTNCR